MTVSIYCIQSAITSVVEWNGQGGTDLPASLYLVQPWLVLSVRRKFCALHIPPDGYFLGVSYCNIRQMGWYTRIILLNHLIFEHFAKFRDISEPLTYLKRKLSKTMITKYTEEIKTSATFSLFRKFWIPSYQTNFFFSGTILSRWTLSFVTMCYHGYFAVLGYSWKWTMCCGVQYFSVQHSHAQDVYVFFLRFAV